MHGPLCEVLCEVLCEASISLLSSSDTSPPQIVDRSFIIFTSWFDGHVPWDTYSLVVCLGFRHDAIDSEDGASVSDCEQLE